MIAILWLSALLESGPPLGDVTEEGFTRMHGPVVTGTFESYVFEDSVTCYERPIYSDVPGLRSVKCYDDRGRLVAQTRHQNVTITWTTP